MFVPLPPVVTHTDISDSAVLVLSETHDLASHAHSVLHSLALPMNLRSVVCVSGKEPWGWHHIVSGTPVRVANLIKKKGLRMQEIQVLVLNMDVVPEDLYQKIYDVYRLLPAGTKILRGVVGVGSTG